MRRLLTTVVLVVLFLTFSAVLIGPALADCTKFRGQVTCTTFDGPGKNKAGVGETTIVETQGNETNTSPEPQDLDSSQSCKPPNSQGTPCNP